MVWLVEIDVGGYDYQLLEVFSNQHAAESFVQWYGGSPTPTARGVALLDAPAEPPTDKRDYRPLAWGSR